MKITFDHASAVENTAEKSRKSPEAKQLSQTLAGYINVAFDGKERAGFGTVPGTKKKSEVPAVSNEAQTQVQNMRNQMTVLSHTMSDEDFAKLQKEGYDPSEMEPTEAVTILDKIKAELLKAGTNVAGFTDRMDMDTLAAAVGSEGLAATLAETFAKQDIPFESQNVEQVVWALDIAKQIKEPTEGCYYYMAANGMEATLTDFYLAGASGSRLEQVQTTGYFSADDSGYVTRNVDMGTGEKPQVEEQLGRLLQQLGLSQDESTMELAGWLVDKGLEVDADSLGRMKDIFAVKFPLEPERIIETAVSAIADGVPVGARKLTETESIYQKAGRLFDLYQGAEGLTLVQDRTQLEEIRLRMTVEANVKLIKSGFAIDTAPIEETIEALKRAHQELAKEYFPGVENPQERYELLRDTNQRMKELPGLPLAMAAKWTERIQTGTLAAFHAEGVELAKAYEAAGERYEALMTAPRADLGDSIKRAFANVDEILKDLGYEATEENRKAVRALGYNRMDMTAGHVDKVKEALRSVDKIVDHMTPAAVLKMIRDGKNPLESTLEELNTYFEELPEEFHQTAQKYSKFLYALEHQGEITSQEREAFIGCYRLMNQLEKSDGAAVGALVNIGGELNFRNLLTAIRSGKFHSMDVKVDDMVGALTEDALMKFSISEQIEQAFVKEQGAQSRQMLKDASTATEGAYELLERGEVPHTPENIVAANALEKQSYDLFEQLLAPNRRNQKKPDTWQKLEEKKAFAEDYQAELQEELQQLEEELTGQAENQPDIRSRKLMHKQLHIMQALSEQEEYFFPMEIDGKVTGVHLQFVSSETEQGMVRISLESGEDSRLTGQMKVTDRGVEGYFVGNNRDTVMKLKNSSDIINSSIRKEWSFCEIEYVYSEVNDIPMDWTRRSSKVSATNGQLYELAKNFLQAVKGMGEA